EIVKCRCYVKQLGVEPQFLLATLLGGEQINANRVIEKQIAGMLTKNPRRLSCQKRIGNDDGASRIGHDPLSSRWKVAAAVLPAARGSESAQAATESTILPFG